MLSTVRLSDFGLQREPPRPLDDRTSDYEGLFDADTLFYDVFRTADSHQILCLGPPLLNCEQALAGMVFRDAATQAPLTCTYRAPRSDRQPSCRFSLTGPGLAETDRIAIDLLGRSVIVPVSPSGHARLAGRRVILTLSKDNPLPWIQDWARFNATIHGADAVLLYDNGSTAYEPAQIRECLRSVTGIVETLIVPWVFPYGPGVGPRNVQDSFYCQPGALEHARWRYCSGARAVLNTDIDELVALKSGGSIFERAESSGAAVVTFPGIWVERCAADARAWADVRHSDCIYRERRQAIIHRLHLRRGLLRTKWVAVPERCSDDVDWRVHDVHAVRPQQWDGKAPWAIRARDVLYRHFRQINTGWKTPRWRMRRHSPIRHLYDATLAQLFATAFPQRRIEQPRRVFDGWRRWFT